MSNKIITILPLFIILFLFSPLQAQKSSNILATASGTGYEGSGNTKSMTLSVMGQGTTHPQDFGFSLNNNTVTVGSSGSYKILVASGASEKEIVSHQLGYKIYVNNQLVSSATHTQISASGAFEFKKNLRQGDKIKVEVSKNFDFPANSGENVLRLEKLDK